ncbi:MAG TPA: hypothetical protein VJK25_00045 [Patescibacteria group bacterium]|nr:hypothetical protein [Patescibacteria group bacterium]
MKVDEGFKKLGEIKRGRQIKPPFYQWQDLALRIINELNIPSFKRNSVFKVCKENDKNLILGCLNDTKELCQDGPKWKYFFKLISEGNKKDG